MTYEEKMELLRIKRDEVMKQYEEAKVKEHLDEPTIVEEMEAVIYVLDWVLELFEEL